MENVQESTQQVGKDPSKEISEQLWCDQHI